MITTAAALAAALLFAVAAATQHRAARTGAGLTRLARQPLWLLGGACDAGAVALQAVALSRGSVAFVQALLAAGLPLAVLLSTALDRRRPTGAEAVGLLLCAPGLALLAGSIPETAAAPVPSATGAVVLTAVVSLAVLARGEGGLRSGAAAGTVVGAGAVLLAVSAHDVALTSWTPYATLVVGALGLWLSQVAFRTPGLATPLTALTVAEPLAAAGLAAAVLHQRLPHVSAPGALLALAGLVVLGSAQRLPVGVEVGEGAAEQLQPVAGQGVGGLDLQP